MDVVDIPGIPRHWRAYHLLKPKKELTPEQRAVELKKHVARRGESKLRAAKAKADATKVKVAELM
jgi:hypothetical protein